MNRDILENELERDEGFRPYAYRDSLGFLTIGYGRMVDQRAGGGITRDEARYLLNNDLDEVEADLDAHFSWWREMTETRQRVLANMAFNLGIAKLKRFTNTLAAMERGDYEAAAKGMLASLWAQQVKGRAERLAEMMREG